MPTVRRYPARQVQVEPSPAFRPTAATSPEEEGAGLARSQGTQGEAVAQVGGALRGLGRALHGIALDQQERQAAFDVLSADNQLTAWQTARLYDPQTGALQQTGKNARGIADTVLGEFDEQSGAVQGTLPSIEARDQFAQLRVKRRTQLELDLRRHEFDQTRAFEQGEVKAKLEQVPQTAAAHADDPAAVKEALDEGERVLSVFGAKVGLGPEARAQVLEELRTKTHVGVIERYLAQGQDRKARAYYEETQGQIAGEARTQIEKGLAIGSTRGESQRASDAIMAGRPVGAIEPGNIDLKNRPRVKNADGSISTLRSISVEIDGQEILIPTVSPDGKILSNADAVALYERTRQHLGKFTSAEAATAYANILHKQQAGEAPTLADYLAQARTIADPEVRDATEQRVRQRWTEQQTSEEDAHRQLLVDAGNLIDKTKTFDAIPPGWLAKMSVQEKGSFELYARRLTGGPIETDPVTFYRLRQTLANDPEAFKRANLLTYLPYLSKSDFQEFVRLQTDPTALRTATIDADLFRQLADGAGLHPYATGQTETQKRDLGELETLVKGLVSQAEAAKKGPLTFEEKRLLMQGVVDQKVFLNVWGSDPEKIAALVTNPKDRAIAYVPIAQIPKSVLADAANYLRTIGASPATLDDAAILSTHRDRVQHAYALRLMGAGADEIRAALAGK